MTEPSTPLMRQYAAIKKAHPQTLLFFRLGDFYELFFDDAVVAARELQITLTSRNKEKGIAIPMCGVPYHAAEGYISKLIRKGFKVAICDQVEDPRVAKTLIRREVTRVVTPGTAADASLTSEENNFLAAVAQVENAVGFAALDYPWTLSTVIWGLAIGAAALLATAFASAILRDSRDGAALTLGTALALGKALAVAFVAYQAVLVLVALWLGGLESFTPAIIGQFALLNLAWAVVLVGIWELLRCANASALPATGAAAGSG